MTEPTLADRIDALLPQTQCTKCGYDGCRPYAEAIATATATHNRCVPGGARGIARLSALLAQPALALDPACGVEAPRRVAWIEPRHCIGCTKCIDACPVDAIVGAPKRMHTVFQALCTGCDLCVTPCPVDCIEMRECEPARDWTDADADAARRRYLARRERLALEREAGRGATPFDHGEGGESGESGELSARREAAVQAAVRAAIHRARAAGARWPAGTGERFGQVNAAGRAQIFERLRALDPTPTTELEYSTPFELLVAVILSAQATDRSVNLATRELFPRANTPEAIAALGVDGLVPFISSIGLFRSKARHLIEACRMLVDQHGGEVPRTRDALEALPGVGRKTANVVLNTAFGEPTIAVDTHIFRVANRTGLASGRTPREVEDRLVAVVPEAFARDAHHWLILHGRYLCKARRPECWRCPIADLCEHPDKTPAPAAPAAPAASRRAPARVAR